MAWLKIVLIGDECPYPQAEGGSSDHDVEQTTCIGSNKTETLQNLVQPVVA